MMFYVHLWYFVCIYGICWTYVKSHRRTREFCQTITVTPQMFHLHLWIRVVHRWILIEIRITHIDATTHLNKQTH